MPTPFLLFGSIGSLHLFHCIQRTTKEGICGEVTNGQFSGNRELSDARIWGRFSRVAIS